MEVGTHKRCTLTTTYEKQGDAKAEEISIKKSALDGPLRRSVGTQWTDGLASKIKWDEMVGKLLASTRLAPQGKAPFPVRSDLTIEGFGISRAGFKGAKL